MTTVQIIRDDTHAIVFVRGEHGVNTISLQRRDVTADAPRIRKLVRAVERRVQEVAK